MKRGDILWGGLLLCISAFLIIPKTHEIFLNATTYHPYITGFIKFSIMATMGECLSLRIGVGKWNKTEGMLYKAFVWGIVGMLTVLMFNLYSNGVSGAVKAHLLFSGAGFFGALLNAFLISALMNLTFSPVFMAAHRVSDTFIESRSKGRKITINEIITKTDWPGFINFVVGKTILFFWIPAHTITFMLPPVYRIIVAAYLSIALGIILTFAKRKQTLNTNTAVI